MEAVRLAELKAAAEKAQGAVHSDKMRLRQICGLCSPFRGPRPLEAREGELVTIGY